MSKQPKLYNAYISESNPTYSVFSSTYLTNIFVIAYTKKEAKKKVQERLDRMLAERATLRQSDNQEIKDAIEDAIKFNEEWRAKGFPDTNLQPIYGDLLSFSKFKITQIEEEEDGIGVVYYTGTG